jgi:hypothetical protein
VVVWPWEVVYSIVDLRVWISCTFSAELEDGPVSAMLVIEKLDKLVSRISICFLWPDRARSRGYDDEVCNIAKIEACFRVSRSGAGDNLPEYGSLAMDQQQYAQGIKNLSTPFEFHGFRRIEILNGTHKIQYLTRCPSVRLCSDAGQDALFQLRASCDDISGDVSAQLDSHPKHHGFLA